MDLNKQRLIDSNEFRRRIIAFATGLHSEVLSVDSIIMMLNQSDTVDAVPIPVRIGQTFYMNHTPWSNEVQIEPYQVTSIQICQNKKGNWTKTFQVHWLVNGKTKYSSQDISFEDVGVTAFFTREDAEAALVGGKDNEH